MLFTVIVKAEMNSQYTLYTKNKWMRYFLKFMHEPNCYAGTIKKIKTKIPYGSQFQKSET